jgi:hypothetical protein
VQGSFAHQLVQIVSIGCPAREPRRFEFVDPEPTRLRELGLFRIRSHDFEIGEGAERDETIAGSKSKMLTPWCCTNAQQLLKLIDPEIQVWCCINEVVDPPQKLGRCDCTCAKQITLPLQQWPPLTWRLEKHDVPTGQCFDLGSLSNPTYKNSRASMKTVMAKTMSFIFISPLLRLRALHSLHRLESRGHPGSLGYPIIAIGGIAR